MKPSDKEVARPIVGALASDCESVELLPHVGVLMEMDSLVREAIRFEIGPALKRGDVCVIADRSWQKEK